MAKKDLYSDPFNDFIDTKAFQAKTSVASTAPYVRDMLKLAWVAAQAVFGAKAKPEHAVMLLPYFLDAAAGERQALLAEAAARTQAEGEPRRRRPPAAR